MIELRQDEWLPLAISAQSLYLSQMEQHYCA